MHPSDRKKTHPTLVTGRSIIKFAPKIEVQVGYDAGEADEAFEASEEFKQAYEEMETAVELNIQGGMFNLPPTPISPMEDGDPFQKEGERKLVDENRNSMEQEGNPTPSELVSSVLPLIDDYKAIKVTKAYNPPSPKGVRIINGEEKEDTNATFIARKFPTCLIPYNSPYWGEGRTCLVLKRSRDKSTFDGAMISYRRDLQGRGYAMRNYTGVKIYNLENYVEDVEPIDVIHRKKHREHRGIFPTAFIPADSPYYASMVSGMVFPKVGYKWYHGKGCDGVRVKFRVDSRRFVHAERNGSTVLLYSVYKTYKSSNLRANAHRMK